MFTEIIIAMSEDVKRGISVATDSWSYRRCSINYDIVSSVSWIRSDATLGNTGISPLLMLVCNVPLQQYIPV